MYVQGILVRRDEFGPIGKELRAARVRAALSLRPGIRGMPIELGDNVNTRHRSTSVV